MKNLVKLIGFVAIIAVIGFSMAACGGGEEEWLDVQLPEAKGKLTIKLIPEEHVGKYIRIIINTTEFTRDTIFPLYGMNGLSFWSDINKPTERIHLVKIESPNGYYGAAEIPLYYINRNHYSYDDSDFVAYEGNDARTAIAVYAWIYDSDSVTLPIESLFDTSSADNDNFRIFEDFKNGNLEVYWD